MIPQKLPTQTAIIIHYSPFHGPKHLLYEGYLHNYECQCDVLKREKSWINQFLRLDLNIPQNLMMDYSCLHFSRIANITQNPRIGGVIKHNLCPWVNTIYLTHTVHIALGNEQKRVLQHIGRSQSTSLQRNQKQLKDGGLNMSAFCRRINMPFTAIKNLSATARHLSNSMTHWYKYAGLSRIVIPVTVCTVCTAATLLMVMWP